MKFSKLNLLVDQLKSLGYNDAQLASAIGTSFNEFSNALNTGNNNQILNKLIAFFDLTLEDDLTNINKNNICIPEKDRYHKNVSSVLKYLMNDVGGISEGELSRRTGVPQPTIHRILSGMTPSPRIQAIQPLAEFFNITSDQLLARVPLPEDRVPGSFDATARIRKTIPVITLQDAIKWPVLMKKIAKENWQHWISTDLNLSDLSYALKLTSNSNFIAFRTESTLIVDYQKKPSFGSYVVIHVPKAESAIITRRADAEGILMLDEVQEKFIAIDDHIRFLGVIVEVRRTMK